MRFTRVAALLGLGGLGVLRRSVRGSGLARRSAIGLTGRGRMLLDAHDRGAQVPEDALLDEVGVESVVEDDEILQREAVENPVEQHAMVGRNAQHFGGPAQRDAEAGWADRDRLGLERRCRGEHGEPVAELVERLAVAHLVAHDEFLYRE